MRKRPEPTDEERRQAIAEMMERWSWRETLQAFKARVMRENSDDT